MSHPSPENCATCPVHNVANLVKLGVDMENYDYVVALAGNPNTGKSTVFNALTGLRQHTGNWPGKTVARAEGGFSVGGDRYKLVDLPGTYSLLSASLDEEIARDFILFGQPDVTVIVVDATRLERNLNLVLQVLEITDRAVVCLNLMDEARRKGLEIDERRLARDLGVPVVATSARYGEGLDELNQAVSDVASGRTVCKPRRAGARAPALEKAVTRLAARVEGAFPGLPNARWAALRLLDGDRRIAEAVRSGELGELREGGEGLAASDAPRGPDSSTGPAVLDAARKLRWKVGKDFHQKLMEGVYAEAARLADRAVTRTGETPRFDWDRTIDRLVTSRAFGFPIMLGLLTAVFWVTIAGANVPSSMLATLLIDKLHPILKAGAAALSLPLVARRPLDRRRVPRYRLGGGGDAAADGDLLSALHAARGLRLPAARRIQPRPHVQTRRGTRQAGLDDGDGFGVQRRRDRVHADHRQPARALDRDHHEQLRALQRAVADPDSDRVDLRRRPRSRAPGRPDLRLVGGRHRGARRRAHVRGLVAPVAHRSARRGLDFQSRAASVPSAADPADHLHLDHRPHAHRAVARGDLRRAGGRRYLAPREHQAGRIEPGGVRDQRS